MTRFSKSATVLCAVLVALVAGGCGKSGAPTASPITDPSTLMTQSLVTLQSARTVHFDATMQGSLGPSLLKAAGLGLGGSLKLDGATIDGDIDVPRQAAHVHLSVPSIFGLSVDNIQVDGYLYTMNSVQSDMYSKSKAQPFPIGTNGPSTSFDLSKTLGNLKDSLSSSGATATIKGFEKVDGRDAYRVALDLPLSKLNDLLATQGGSAAANMTVDSASLDYWVYSDTLQPAKVEIKGSAADFGKIDMTITLTKYNQKITITAPPADKIQDGS